MRPPVKLPPEIIEAAARHAERVAVERLRGEVEGKALISKVEIPVNTARLVLAAIDSARLDVVAAVANWGADDTGAMPAGLYDVLTPFMLASNAEPDR